MSAASDEAWALWAALGPLSDGQLANLVTVSRARMPQDLRARLAALSPPLGLPGKLSALADLRAIEKLTPADADKALAVWILVAEDTLGAAFGRRLAERHDALAEPGRDPKLHGVAERAKVDLRDDLVDIAWLDQGRQAAQAVCFFEVPIVVAGARTGTGVGTGFLVSVDRRHVMTAYHVLVQRDDDKAPDAADLDRQVRGATVAFDYVAGGTGAAGTRGTPLAVDALVAHSEALDCAVVRLAAPVPFAPLPLFTGHLPALDGDVGFAANIVQHPLRDGLPQPKQLGLRNNAVWKIDGKNLYYFTDTRAGSSGSPVLSDGWMAIAIHTGYDPFKNASYMGRSQGFANRGSLMSLVVAELAPPLAAAGVDLRTSGS